MGTILELIFRPPVFWTLWTILLIASSLVVYLVQLDEWKKEKELKSIKGQLKDCILKNEELVQNIKTIDSNTTGADLKTNLIDERKIDLKDLISSFAVEVWRLEKKVNQAKSLLKGNEDTNSLQDQLQRIKDVLAKQEIEIQEFTGTTYNDGMSLKVLHVEEVDSLPKGTMQIVETVKPTVYFKGEAICHGEIIVGKPKDK